MKGLLIACLIFAGFAVGGRFAGGVGSGPIPIVAQEQTVCSKPDCRKTIQPDWKFCLFCGTQTDFGKYSDLMQSAQSSFDAKNFDVASQRFVEAATRRVSGKRKGAALLGAARSFLQLKEVDRALAEAGKARGLDPENYEPVLLLGEIAWVHKGDAASATSFFEEANRLSGKPELTARLLGDIAFQRKDFAKAASLYALVERQFSKDGQFQFRWAVCLQQTKGDPAQIEARLKAAHALIPDYVPAIVELARLAESRKQHREAAGYWGKASAAAAVPYEFPLRQGLNLYLAEDWKGAQTAFEATLRRNPAQLDALMGLARIEIYHFSNPKAAVGHLERAKRIDPRAADVDFLLGLASDLVDPTPFAFLIEGKTVDRSPAWHPDGRRIAFQSDRDKNSHIFIAEPGKAPRKMTTKGNNGDPAFSPDGQWLAFHSEQGNSDIWIMRPDGTGVTQITNHGSQDESPTFSEDSRTIAFQSKRDGGKWHLFAIGLDGKGERQLTSGPQDDISPRWSPDGSAIVFTTGPIGKREIALFDVKTRQVRKLTADAFDDVYPSWSPDGKRIVFSSQREGPIWKLFVMDRDGRNLTRISDEKEEVLEPAWNPNGVRIAATVGRIETATSGGGGYSGPTTRRSINYDIRTQLAPRVRP